MALTIDKYNTTVQVVGAVVIITLVAVLMLISAHRESQTPDEAVYLASGISYWKTRDFRLNIEHPPFLKELLSLPLLFQGVRFSPDHSDWKGASGWDVAPKTLFRNVVPGLRLLLSGRTVNVLLTLVLIVISTLWVAKTWGRASAIVTFVLLSFEPNILAHGHLATTDLGYTLGVIGSIFTFGLFLEQHSLRRLLLAAAVCGLSLATRFNAVLLIPLILVLYLFAHFTAGKKEAFPLPGVVRVFTAYMLVGIVVMWALYGFEIRPLNEVQDTSAHEVLAGHGNIGTRVQSLPLPAASYLSGLLWQVKHNVDGMPAYFFGKSSSTGWWYYFPVAMVIKMTLGSLVLGLVGLSVALSPSRNFRTGRVFTGWFIALPFMILTIASMFSRLNIGVRYVLPSIVLLTMVAGASWQLAKSSTIMKTGIIALVLFHAVSVLRYSPHFIPYANELFGGPSRLHNYLIDSNLDWGQDLPLLREYLDQNGISDYRFRSFTNAPADVYGLYESDIPTDQEVLTKPFSGVVAVGISYLYFPLNADMQWLKKISPTAVLGHSIYVYDFRPKP